MSAVRPGEVTCWTITSSARETKTRLLQPVQAASETPVVKSTERR
jgi:hypothetical protein